MFPGLTAGQGGATLHTLEGKLLSRRRDPSLLPERETFPSLSFHLFSNSARIGSCGPFTLLVISLNCSGDMVPGGIALAFFAF